MLAKTKIRDIANDFSLKPKDITGILERLSAANRSSQTVLSDDEADFLFSEITKQFAVESFMDYFSMPKPEPPAPKPEEKPAPKPEEKPAPKAEEKPAAKEEAPAQKPQQPAAGDRRPTGKPIGQQPAAKPQQPAGQPAAADRHPTGKPIGQRPVPKPAGQQPAANGQPFKKKERAHDPNFVQARTKGERRTVNTRTEDVDLDKYNEHYDALSTGAVGERDSDSSRKQRVGNGRQRQQPAKKPIKKRRETAEERQARIAEERAKRDLVVKIGESITVSELASLIKVNATEVIRKLMSYGVMAALNVSIDYDTAEVVASEFGAKVEREVVVSIEDRIIDATEDKEEDLEPRSPVVVVMGHVDHGKTSILDAIRNTHVTASESGGITQHIGAYRVDLDGQEITFLDTPGHAAFTEMRARGAKATDIAVLVVAADDGIMPQTIEAINHAKAAEVSIVVAINKMDRPDASPDRVMQQLTEYGLVPEEWGGDTICVPVSAKTHMNIDKLLEAILLVSEMRELRANPHRPAKGVVIEARLDKGKGPIATLLVQNGTLRAGDVVVAGTAVGRIRVMTDYKGRRIKAAGPSVPVEVMGLAEVPMSGDAFDAVSDERLARELVEQRRQQIREAQLSSYQRVTLDNLFSTLEAGEVKELNIIIKADVQGSVEALKQNLEKLSNDEVRVRVIHGAVGAIVESDVMLASASNAIIIGFHVRPDAAAEAHAEREKVEMRMYSVIYNCIEDVEAAIKGMLAPKFREVALGKAEVRRVFRLSSAGTIAGSHVISGKVARSAKIRVVRDGIVIAEDQIASLKREKDDAKEVPSGFDCGIGLEKFNDIKEGDILEAYQVEEYREG